MENEKKLNTDQKERLFASFILDEEAHLEIALQAEHVMEATKVTGAIRPVPGSANFLEGFMTLRKNIIPIINLKKRLVLSDTEYGDEAKIAVIDRGGKRYGLLFEDICDVFRVSSQDIQPLDQMLMSDDQIITDIIRADDGQRMLEILDLERLFPNGASDIPDIDPGNEPIERTYIRYVVFSCGSQIYGVPVNESQEICFLSDLDTMFQSGQIEGALQLRGNTIPVLHSASLLGCNDADSFIPDEYTRILVMKSDGVAFGLIVNRVHQILTVADDEILPVPGAHISYLNGVCRTKDSQDILLLGAMELIDSQMEKIKAMGRISKEREEEYQASRMNARHIITENCYLIFSIGKNYAIELKDVQEILDTDDFLITDSDSGLVNGIINLRGEILPVLDLREFYPVNGGREKSSSNDCKLVIGHDGCNKIALLVDEIVTIFKQEQFHTTPSLKPELQDKKDTLDRLIEFRNDQDLKEHVLVVNVKSILRNHLFILPDIANDQEEDISNDEVSGNAASHIGA